jgi:FAD/FMN-containing dehydrogenase
VDLFNQRRLIAKFVLAPTALADVVLGVNFLVDNDLELMPRGAGGSLPVS